MQTYKGKHGLPCNPDKEIREIDEKEFDALVIPGGYAPDYMRRSSKILELTKAFHEKQKPIAFICHAGWVLALANILQGIKCTSFFSIKDDLIHAGAIWVDEALVIDKHIISSRNPDDLPFFCKGIIKTVAGELVRI